jgi:hypothetical protein
MTDERMDDDAAASDPALNEIERDLRSLPLREPPAALRGRIFEADAKPSHPAPPPRSLRTPWWSKLAGARLSPATAGLLMLLVGLMAFMAGERTGRRDAQAAAQDAARLAAQQTPRAAPSVVRVVLTPAADGNAFVFQPQQKTAEPSNEEWSFTAQTDGGNIL